MVRLVMKGWHSNREGMVWMICFHWMMDGFDMMKSLTWLREYGWMMMDCKWFNPPNEMELIYCNELDWMITCWRLVNDEKLTDSNWFELREFCDMVMDVVLLNEFSPNVNEFSLFKLYNDNCEMDVNDEWWIDSWINCENWDKSIMIGPLNEFGNIFKYWREWNDDWAMNDY